MSTSENSFSRSGRPLPPTGAVSPASGADAELHEALRRGEYCLVLTPSEIGKLARVRAAAHLREEGMTIVVLARKAANNRDHTGNVLIQGPGGQAMHMPYWVRFGSVNSGPN